MAEKVESILAYKLKRTEPWMLVGVIPTGHSASQCNTNLVLVNRLECPGSFCEPVKGVTFDVKCIGHRPVQHRSVQHLQREISISK